MSDDLAKMSLDEMRKKLVALEADRVGRPRFFVMMAGAGSEEEFLALYRKHQEQLGDLRYLDLRINHFKSAIQREEKEEGLRKLLEEAERE